MTSSTLDRCIAEEATKLSAAIVAGKAASQAKRPFAGKSMVSVDADRVAALMALDESSFDPAVEVRFQLGDGFPRVLRGLIGPGNRLRDCHRP